MKKTHILLAAIILANCITASAQLPNTSWSTSGNIGIGTTTPTANLEIDHSANSFPATGFSPALKINGDDRGTDYYDLLELWANTYIPIFPRPTSTSQKLFFVTTAGFCGINKPLAYYTLDVGGNIWADNNVLTGGYMGVGVTAPATVNDARMHIYNTVYNVGNSGSEVPGLRIDRTFENNFIFHGTVNHSQPNIFEVWYYHNGIGGAHPTLTEVIDPNGNFGINTPTPGAPLDVNGNAIIRDNLTVTDAATVHTLTVTTNAEVGNNLTVANIATVHTLSVTANAEVEQVLTVNSAAIIGISSSTTSPIPLTTPGLGTTYSLYVANGILTEKLKVANSTDSYWSDFVFNKEYDLMPLNKVESYIKTNKHLPEIPSASEVQKEGIDVANMDAKLLQKIEELTLYVIQQQKEIDDLKKQIKN